MSFQSNAVTNNLPSNVRTLRPEPITPPGGRKNKAPTVEFLFTEAMSECKTDFRIGVTENIHDTPDTNIYRWMENEVGARWQLTLDAHVRGFIQEWLRMNMCTDLSREKIGSCLNVWRDQMVHARKTIPPFNEECDVVPLRNAYLLIDKKGVIRAVHPHPMYGQTFNIQADLDWERVDENGIYAPAAPKEGSHWHHYLSSTFQDRAVYEIAQEAFSMALLSKCYEKGVIMYGTGSNGKSIMLHVLRSLCPSATQTVKLTRLVKNEFGTSSLIAKKIAIVTEMPRVLSSEIQDILKALISRDPTPVEFKGGNQFDFIPMAAWFMATNHHCSMPDHEYGWWRKNITLPFLNRIEKGDRNTDLKNQLIKDPAEMIQIIDWLLIGGARLTARGRFLEDDELPAAISDLAHTQRVSSDPVAAWIEDAEPKCSAMVWTSKTEIYEHFKAHVEASGRRPVSAIAFWLRMAEYFRAYGLKTQGEQLTLPGKKRDRYVMLAVPDIHPGKFTVAVPEPPKAGGPIKDDWKELVGAGTP